MKFINPSPRPSKDGVMKEFGLTAERIIKRDGLSFALAARCGVEGDIMIARDFLKEAIVKALEEAFEKGKMTV